MKKFTFSIILCFAAFFVGGVVMFSIYYYKNINLWLIVNNTGEDRKIDVEFCAGEKFSCFVPKLSAHYFRPDSYYEGGIKLYINGVNASIDGVEHEYVTMPFRYIISINGDSKASFMRHHSNLPLFE